MLIIHRKYSQRLSTNNLPQWVSIKRKINSKVTKVRTYSTCSSWHHCNSIECLIDIAGNQYTVSIQLIELQRNCKFNGADYLWPFRRPLIFYWSPALKLLTMSMHRFQRSTNLFCMNSYFVWPTAITSHVNSTFLHPLLLRDANLHSSSSSKFYAFL